MKRIVILLGLVMLLLSFGNLYSPIGNVAHGPIAPYLNGVFPDLSPSAGDWEVELAFPNQEFIDPMAMHELPDQSGYLIAGKTGLFYWIAHEFDSQEQKIVLDITDAVMTGEDSGLMNFVLHPEFGDPTSANKGYLYTMYAYHPNISHGNDPRMNRLSRFTYDANAKLIDPASEFILLQDYDPQGYHQGGGMFFDNQGFLNFTVGDGGGSSFLDFPDYNQQIDKSLWSGLFRIDVDQNPTTSHPVRKQPTEAPGKPNFLPETFSQGYFIPNDNPWQDESGNTMEEFFALGLRSPHRATYDPITENIWVGDVGEGGREEITILPKGGNAQWPYREGNIAGKTNRPATIIGTEASPKFDYVRSVGVAVIGGFVYRGDLWNSSLDGFYLFAEFSNGNIWSLNPVTEEVKILATHNKDGNGSKSGISSFATNQAGEIFLLNLYQMNKDGGSIYRLKLNQEDPEPIPQTLSETGAFSNINELTTASGIIPYRTNSPLWSDAAVKDRWVAIPNDGAFDTPEEQVVFSEQDHWKFPPGTVFIKHFELPIDENEPSLTRRLETRFIIIDKESVAYGLTYKWNEDGSEAVLLNTELEESYEVKLADGSTNTQTWSYPNSLQCNSCHTPNAGYVLGVKTAQLNGDLEYIDGTFNQLSTWEYLNIFSNSIDDIDVHDLPAAVSIDDPEASDEDKVMSYLDANCAHCHRPNGVNGIFDARLATPLFYKSIIQSFGASHNTPFGAKMIVPGHPEESQIWLRDNSVGLDKMPPISKNIVDQEYINVLTRWIENIDESKIGPCEVTYLSDLDAVYEIKNGWGPIEFDLANGENQARDGSIMSLAGVPFSRGIGTHAASEVQVDLECKYDVFSAYIGVDDGSCPDGSVVFEVWADNKRIFISDLIQQGESAQLISLDVMGVTQLRLIATDGDGNSACDHANWAEAKVQTCQKNGLTNIAKAFAFGATTYTTKLANDQTTSYTKVVQSGTEHLYTPEKGYGYTDVSGIDNTPNNRDVVNEELYNQFIGAKTGGITFRVDLPNGTYRMVVVGGDPNDNKKSHNIKVRDGSSGYFNILVNDLQLEGPSFYKVGFNDVVLPDEENVHIGAYFNSPSIVVTKGYIEILQSSNKQSGGDICFLEIWPESPKVQSLSNGGQYGTIDLEIMPNPFSTELEYFLYQPDENISSAELFVYDINGRLFYQNMSVQFGFRKSIPIDNGWSPGTYIMQVRAGDYRSSVKLIKQ